MRVPSDLHPVKLLCDPERARSYGVILRRTQMRSGVSFLETVPPEFPLCTATFSHQLSSLLAFPLLNPPQPEVVASLL